MKVTNGSCRFPAIIALLIMFMCSPHSSFAGQVWEEEGTELVARITVIEGRLERFDPETNAWMITVPDAPVGIDDQIFAGADSRVEILIPNNTILRIGQETEIRLVSLMEKLTEIELSSGKARLYNNSSQTDIVAATPFGRIAVPPGASVDLYVDDKAVEVISLDDRVYFTSDTSTVRHEVIAGSASLLAYSDHILPSNGSTDPVWNSWNRERDTLWAERRRSSGESQDYLPTTLGSEAYVLDTCGSWQRVNYEGEYYRFWRPRYVGFGWTPFTEGTWMNWRGDRVWISHEPFGYVTHHYGNWIYTLNTWYWAPPVSRAMVRTGLPLMNIGYCWYPGRVAWIDVGVQAGWIPLAPFEPYYCRYPWGLHTIVIGNGAYPRYAASHKFKYRRHTVAGRQEHFYRDKRGTHVSKWRTAGRSGVHTPLVPRNEDRSEIGSFRNTREKKSGTPIREDGRWEARPTRDRLKQSEMKREENQRGEGAGRIRSGYTPSWKTGNRKSTVGPEKSAPSISPEKSPIVNEQLPGRRGNQLKEQNRPARPAGNIQQTETQNRPDVTRTDKNALRTDPPDNRVEGQIRNRHRPVTKEDNRKPTGAPDNGAVSNLPVENRQPADQIAAQRSKSNPLNKENRFQPAAGSIQRSGSQNRTGGLTRTDRNAFRKGNSTNQNR